MNTRSMSAALVGLGLALSLSACSSASDAAEETAQDNAVYCQSAAEAQAEIAALESLIASDATLDQVRDQRDKAVAALKTARDDADDLAESVRNQIDIADEAFDDAMATIPGDATVSQAAAAYNEAIKAWNAALLGIRSDVGCS